MSHKNRHQMQKSLSPGELRVQLQNALARIARLEADNQEMALGIVKRDQAIAQRDRIIVNLRKQIDQQHSGILLPGDARMGG